MKDANKIFTEAKNSPRVYDNHNAITGKEYDVSYMLSQEQIHAAALLKISEGQQISFKAAAEKYYIDGVSVNMGDKTSLTAADITDFFGETLGNVTLHTQQGKTAFLSLEDNHHFVTLAIIPDKDNHNKLSVVYVNSIIDSPIDSPPYSEVGKTFAEAVVKYLKDPTHNDKKETGEGFINKSVDQQLSNCCGLSVATNIAAIANHIDKGGSIEKIQDALFVPATLQEKTQNYKEFGALLFSVLDNDNFKVADIYIKEKPVNTTTISSHLKTEISNIASQIPASLVTGSPDALGSKTLDSSKEFNKPFEEKRSMDATLPPPSVKAKPLTIEEKEEARKKTAETTSSEIFESVKELGNHFGEKLSIGATLPDNIKTKPLTIEEKEELRKNITAAKKSSNFSKAIEFLKAHSPQWITTKVTQIITAVYPKKDKQQGKSWRR